ncbi:hypothetical protein IP87_00230 [beta proteobacterium AAP121]|nr:hypothetical protein IP80_13325 [beta proteobacterium AAP65]KPG01098.1 hypothetical protein IP87_00230 [beta proteobacterium AAP121]
MSPLKDPAAATDSPVESTSAAAATQPAARASRQRPAAPNPTRKSAPRKTAPEAAAPSKRAKTKAATQAQPLAQPEAAADAQVAESPRKRAKLVRDSFTMPQFDFDLIDAMKARTLALKRPTKKSELLRAGLHALSALKDRQLLAALESLQALKPGRPKKLG